MQISPKIVWILNISPDSFSDWKTYDENSLIDRINYLKNAKADIIDVWAESTAPNSLPVSLDEELKRLKIFFEIISEFPDISFSLDTMKAKVAEIGIKNWVKIIIFIVK